MRRFLSPSLLACAAALPAADVPYPEPPPVVVTADRQPVTRERTTASVDVVDEADARALGHPNNTWQLLSGLPGVDIATTGGVDGGTVGIRLRGTNSFDTQILVDGLPIDDPTNTQGQGNISVLDGAGLDRIEVVRGGQGGLYGSRAVGGVVNFITARPTATPEISARAEGGSFGTARLEGTATGPLSQSAGYAVSLGGLHSNGINNVADAGTNGRPGDHERDGVDRLGANARVEVAPLADATLYAALHSENAAQEYDGYDASFVLDPEDDASLQRFRLVRGSLGGAFTTGKAEVSVDAAETRMLRTYAAADPSPDNSYRGRKDYLTARVGTEVLTPGKERGWGLDHLGLAIGSDFSHDYATVDAYGAQISESALQTGVWGQALLGDRYLEFSQTARVDRHSREGNNGTFRSGLAAFPSAAVKLHGSVGTTFRAPSLYELYAPPEYSGAPLLGNPDLEAQRARTYDLGHETRLPGGLVLTNTAFRTDYTQAIEYVYDPSAFAGTYQNVDGYRIEGIENSLAWRGEQGFGGWISYTVQRTDLDETEIGSGRAFTGLPKQKASLQPEWRHEQVWVTVRLDVIGRRVVYGAAELPGYALLGAAAGYSISRTWEVYMRGENLGNTAYQTNSGYATPGAAGYAGVTATF
jgi:vitamin B12 transporter